MLLKGGVLLHPQQVWHETLIFPIFLLQKKQLLLSTLPVHKCARAWAEIPPPLRYTTISFQLKWIAETSSIHKTRFRLHIWNFHGRGSIFSSKKVWREKTFSYEEMCNIVGIQLLLNKSVKNNSSLSKLDSLQEAS